MTGAWGLPMQAELGGVRYAIRSDYRDVLELLRWLNGQADPALDQSERWYVAMRLFYPEFAALPQPLWPDATQFLTEFLAAGRREQPRRYQRRKSPVHCVCTSLLPMQVSVPSMRDKSVSAAGRRVF